MSTVVDPDTNEHDAAVLEPEPVAAEPEALTCPNCGAPADAGQLMCLECGSRLALDYRRPPSWRLPAAIVAIVLLLAGIGVAIALAAVTSNADKTTAAAPTQSATAPASAPADTAATASTPTPTPAPAPTSSTPTPAPAGGATPAGGGTGTGTLATPAPTTTPTSSGWPPGKSAFTVILASMPTKAEADAKLKAAQAAGITTASILHSDDFPTLNAGYWVVFDGQYDTIDQARTQASADQGKGGFNDAYPRFVSKDPNAKP